MKPIEFKGQNVVFAKNQPEFENLPAYCGPDVEGKTVAVTCWEMTDQELQEVVKTKKVFVITVTYGGPIQPQSLEAYNPMIFPEEN